MMSFNGTDKVIKLNAGVRSVEAIDIYSYWKQWVLQGNAQYAPAFKTVGGELLTGSLRSPVYFFLQNGWVVEPASESHLLNVQTNLYSEGGADPFQTPTGDYTIRINNRVSDAQIVTVSTGSGLSTEEAQKLTEVYLALLGRRTQNTTTGEIVIFGEDQVTPISTQQAYTNGQESPLIGADEIKPR